MPRTIGRLTALQVARTAEPGLYPDGGGLYLQVTAGGKSWVYRFKVNGRAREMGLGSLLATTLAEARGRAAEARRLRLDGVDPIEARKTDRTRLALEAAQSITFKACAERYIAANKAGWRNAKHGDQWRNTLTAYAYPVIGALPVAAIDTGHVTRILEPIWATKSETASRVRGRIETILDYATTHRWRSGENPARWRGHLENVLPKRSKVAKVKHHPALPWKEMPAFMVELRRREEISAKALEFTILTAVRTSETIGALWPEIDLREKVWTIPAERMKAESELRVPLSADAVAVLEEITKLGTDGHVFKSGKRGFSNAAMLSLLQQADRMNRPDLTVHGFRSSFRDWAADTGRPDDLAEAALAHAVKDSTVSAYQRSDLLERRRRLMEDWAQYCSGASKPAAATARSA